MSYKEEFKLCYIQEPFAFFTTADLKDQWGDDWNDSCYSCNADEPYEWDERRGCPKYEIMKIAYESELVTPVHGHCNSPWSVEDINAGQVAWLRSPSWSKTNVAIHAGTPMDEFIRIVEEDGGKIYLSKDK